MTAKECLEPSPLSYTSLVDGDGIATHTAVMELVGKRECFFGN